MHITVQYSGTETIQKRKCYGNILNYMEKLTTMAHKGIAQRRTKDKYRKLLKKIFYHKDVLLRKKVRTSNLITLVN